MSTRHKLYNSGELYFVSFAVKRPLREACSAYTRATSPREQGGYDPISRTISYGSSGFDKNYDWLHAVAKEEYLHKIDHLIDPTLSRIDFVKNINSPIVQDNINMGEWRVNMQLYKQQGLFPNSGRNFAGFIFKYGAAAKIYDTYDYFQPAWWHFIYKIPRRF